MILFSYALKEGRGAHLEDHLASGKWSQEERHLHINLLELHAILLALHTFQDRLMGIIQEQGGINVLLPVPAHRYGLS